MESKYGSFNEIYLESSVCEVWRHLVTPEGLNSFLTYTAKKNNNKNRVEKFDIYTLNYGDIENKTTVIQCEAYKRLFLSDNYESMTPDGTIEKFHVYTLFNLIKKGSHHTKLTVSVFGYDNTIHDQWLKECLEMGWRRSLINLKSVLELGMDLRDRLFSYPRLGVTNCSYSIINPNRNIEGNYLLHVFPNSPAEIAGLKKGDTITKVNNYVVPTYKDFVINISKYQDTTDPIYIEFMREEKTKKVKVNLSQSEIFTGQINIHETTIEEIQEKRRQLAKQRSASGELWKVDRND